MERAQVLKQKRGPAAGYRCRRCGEPKRGHICAARTMGEQPEGDDLHLKAAALTELSTHAMKATVDQNPTASGMEAALGVPDGDFVDVSDLPMPRDISIEPLPTGSAPSAPEDERSSSSAGVKAPAMPPLTARPSLLGAVAATPAPPPGPAAALLLGSASAADHSVSRLLGASPFHSVHGAVDSLGCTAGNVDDFLEELRRALDGTTATGVTPTGASRLPVPFAPPTPNSGRALPAAALQSPAVAAGAALAIHKVPPASAVGSASGFLALSHRRSGAGLGEKDSEGFRLDLAPPSGGLPSFGLFSPLGATQKGTTAPSNASETAAAPPPTVVDFSSAPDGA